MKYIACGGIGLALLLGLASIPVASQSSAPANSQSSSSGSSLGDYARQVRKAPAPASKPKVFDNDNLPKDDKLSIVGPSPRAAEESGEAKSSESAPETPAAGAANTPADKASTEAKAPAAEKAAKGATGGAEDEAAKLAALKQWTDKLEAQKQQIDLLSRELDVLQREYQLRAAAMYADAGNRMRNSTDWDKQDAQYKQQIADKQKAVDEAKQKLEDMQEEARKAGVPASVREQQ